MIKIGSEKVKNLQKFWNGCVFHPTDAVEDPWGKRTLDRMAEDKSIDTIRIYTMFEDIVYIDGDGNLAYDYRLNDLRLDYLVEKGYDILLAYFAMPECIATNKNAVTNVSKNKTRYKGKMINTSTPADYKLWEEICYQYTKHIVERYGLEKVASWHIQCYNEPDIANFFMSYLPDDDESVKTRAKEYCKLYKAFVDGISRVSEKLCIGGPALAIKLEFLELFLNYIKENQVRMDFISYHNYAAIGPWELLYKDCGFDVNMWVEQQEKIFDIIKKYGFNDTELIIDEWGMASAGFYNIEECPPFIARETEVYSSYFVKLIHSIIQKGWNVSRLMICLSGQHEMVTDFSGFRNFFTLNFFAKPIYNAHILGAKLHNGLLKAKKENENLFVIPTKNKEGNYSILLTYCSDRFDEDLPEIEEELAFEEDVKDKNIVVYCINKENTNPYRLYERKGMTPELTAEQIKFLRDEGNIKPVAEFYGSEKIKLKLTPNTVYLVEVKK